MESNEVRDESALEFEVGGEAYSLPASEVERVIELRADDISPLPVPNAQLIGLLNVDGQVVALLSFPDIKASLTFDDMRRYIVVNAEQGKFAIEVDQLPKFHKAGDADVGRAPYELSATMLLNSLS